MGVTPITVPQNIALSLAAAGDKNGVDFDYLLQTALRESSLNPSAKARTSSAVGLFQFLESTWLEVMKSDGPRLGYQEYADAIVERDGEYSIKDGKLRAEVLKLREDPQIAADLAAAFTRNNGSYLLDRFGRMPSPGELYIAHFLGAKGAAKLFTAGLDNPDQSAVKLFPRQAAANPSIFHEKGGQARSIRELYQALTAKHEAAAPAGAPAFAVQQMASAALAPLPPPAPLDIPVHLQQGRVPAAIPPAAVPVAPSSTAAAPAQDSRWPTEAVPSRFGPEDVSFTGMFKTDSAPPARTLLTTPAESTTPGGGLFTGLYGE